MQDPPTPTSPPHMAALRARIQLKDGGFTEAEGRRRKRDKGSTLCPQQSTGSPNKQQKREEEREREKIELNSLILNYYLSIMAGMEPGCRAGED